MIKIPAGEFKAKCLKLMDEVQNLHHEIVITKYGKPVAMLVPARPEKKSKDSIVGFMKDSVQIYGDILSTGESWNAEL